MRYIKTFEGHSEKRILIIVDVQRSFRKYFDNDYLKDLNHYCKRFDRVYQIFDNHVDGKSPDKDYLYDPQHDAQGHPDLYEFQNQADAIEKRYRYDVDADFFKDVLDTETYEEVSEKEDRGELKRGDFFPTKEGTIIVYIGNNHKWFDCPNRLYDLFSEIAGAQSDGADEVTMVGGAHTECLADIEITAKALGVRLRLDKRHIYSATECPIK